MGSALGCHERKPHAKIKTNCANDSPTQAVTTQPAHPSTAQAAPAGTAPSAQLNWPSERHTAAFAHALARQSGLEDAIIELHGDLGSGKTTLVRHLLRALGFTGRVKSPTYAVVESYAVPWPVQHFDFYRFSDPQEWEDAGFRDLYAAPGLKLAEWPDHAAAHLPRADLVIRLHTDSIDADNPGDADDQHPDAPAGHTPGRHASLVGQTPLGAALLAGALRDTREKATP